MKSKVAIACDHAGFELKNTLKNHLEKQGFLIDDLGTSSQESVDYPEYGFKIADNISKKKSDVGIAICGSGIGISIACNKNKDIRAALCFNEEMAQLSREHNDANIIALGARFIDTELAIKMVTKFLETDFQGGRHQKRVDKLNNYDN